MGDPASTSTCDWPACTTSAVQEFPLRPGMSLSIDGVTPFDGSRFASCEDHAPRIGRIFLDAIGDALRRHAARSNFAPGDAEWSETFGDQES